MNQHGCVRRVVGWGAALALLLGACSADLKLPSGIQVVCGDGKGCPVGFVCSPAVQRCVPAGERDSDPPVVVAGSARIEPAVAGRDTVVRVEMQVSEPLAFPPAVHLQALDEPALTPVGQEGDTYTFTYQATGEEPEEAVALTADLVDLTGNVVNDTVLDSVTFDFTRPLVSGLELESPSWLTRGATGYARFTLSELPTDPPRVVLEGTERELSPEPGVQPPEYRYAFPVGDDDQEGEYGVLVSVEDDAGNLAMERTLDRFVLDFEPPALVGEPKVLTPAVPPGTVLGIALAVSEELSTDPTVVLQRADGLRIDVTSVQQVGLHYVFARLAPAEEGQYDVHGSRPGRSSTRCGAPTGSASGRRSRSRSTSPSALRRWSCWAPSRRCPCRTARRTSGSATSAARQAC